MTTTTGAEAMTIYVLDPDTNDVWEDGTNDGQEPHWLDVHQVASVEITNTNDAWVSIVDLLRQLDPDPIPTGSLWWLTDRQGFAVSTFADLKPGESMVVEVWAEG